MSRSQPTDPELQVILEEIRSQNRAVLEAVEASRLALEECLDRTHRDLIAALERTIRALNQGSRGRDEALELL